MKTTTTVLATRAFLGALLLTPLVPLSAQTSGAANPPADKSLETTIELSPFEVTADADTGYMSRNSISGTGTNETLRQIPQTIQIANQEVIRDLASDDPMQAIEMTAGSAIRRSYNPGDDTFVWGFRVSSTLKDSVPNTTNAIGTLYDVDRIEVIKGPAAMMFGQNSFTGGVINYVTRKPTRTHKFSTRLSYGSFDYKSAAINASGPLTKSLRYRIDIGATDSDFSKRDFGFYRDSFAGAGIEYDISAKTKLSVDFSYAKVNAFRPKTIIDPATGELIDKPDNYTINQPWGTFPMTQARGMAVLTTALSPRLDSRSFLSYNNSTNDWVRDLAGVINPVTHVITTSTAQFTTSAHYIGFGQSFVGRLETGPLKHKIILGGDQQNNSISQLPQTFVATNSAFNYMNPNYDIFPTTVLATTPTQVSISSRQSGVFVQEQLGFWKDRVKLLAGMRYNEFLQKSGVLTSFSGPATVSQGSKTISRYGVILQPIEAVTLYYNRSQSFLFNGGVDYLNNPLKPSVGINNEFGLKTSFLNGAVAFSVAYFDIELTNVRVVFTQGPNDPLPGASGAKQDGKQTNKGLDFWLSLSKEFGPGTANLIATCYAGDTKTERNVKPTAAVNNTYSLLASYALEKGALKRLKFGGGYIFKGERIVPSASGFPTGVVLKLPSYDVIRAFASYSWKNYSVQINVDNLADKQFVQGAESSVWVQTDPGRSFKGTFTYRF